MKFSEFSEQLARAENFSLLEAVFTVFLNQYGFTHYAYTYYTRHPNSQNKLKYSYASKAHRIWHEHYLDEHYEDVDSFMAMVHHNNLPKFWNLEQQLAAAKTPRERQMRLDSIDYGAETGLCIPVHGAAEDFAVLVLINMKGQHCLDQWQEIQHELLAIAHFYYHYVKNLLLKTQRANDEYELSKNQIKCLLLTAQHYSVAEIASMLNITARTVNFHLQKANKILGTKNKHQSVAKAIAKGLLPL